ncbi:translocation/assembly module TamB domain-containing protein [bacterium]|nr:translocation/assembly module TamB domain-containing protein [bacterium]
MEKQFGIVYDFDSPRISFDGTFSLHDIKISYRDSVTAEIESFSFRGGQKFSGIFKNHAVLHLFEMINTNITVDTGLLASEGESNSGADSEPMQLPSKIPFFPLEEINIKNLNFTLKDGDKILLSSKETSLSGDGLYTLTMPELFIASNSVMKKDLVLGLTFGFTAEDKSYALNSLKINSELLSLSAAQPNGNSDLFSGNIAIKLSEIGELFGLNLTGEFYLDFDLENLATYIPRLMKSKTYNGLPPEPKNAGKINLDVFSALPEINLLVSVSDLNFEGFRPWDIHGKIKMTPTKTFIERLNFFHKNKVSISLDGEFPYSERNVRGSVRLYDFDFDDCLRRMTQSGIVNMIASGKVSYRFDIDRLRAEDMFADLVVTEFDVMHGDLLDLPRDVYVTGHLAIGPDGVDLKDAQVKTADDSSHLYLKGSYYGFADTMKFHIPIVSGSYIDLGGDIRKIAGFNVRGKGPIEVLVTSLYTNPLISSNFKGTACHLAGFNSEMCDIDINLKDFVFDILINEIRQKTISSKDSIVTINFNDDGFPVYFKINKAEGKLSDASALFGVNTDGFSGKAFLQAEGLFKNGLSKLNAEARVKDFRKKGEDGGTKIADSVELLLFEKDAEKLGGKGEITYGRNSIKLDAELAKADLDSNISVYFDSFYPEDFEFHPEISFEKPVLDVKLKGLLSTPNISGRLDIPKLEVYGVETGDFFVEAAYTGENKNVSLNGGFGKNIRFSAEMPELDRKRLAAGLSVKGFTYQKEDMFAKVFLDANLRGEKINIGISSLKAKKSDILIQNVEPFSITGDFSRLQLADKTYFKGEALNFYIEGGVDLEKFNPYLHANGALSLKTLRNKETYRSNNPDGRLNFDIAYKNSNLNGNIDAVNFTYVLQDPRIVLKDFNGTLLVENNKWTLEKLSGNAGDGKLTITGQGNGFMPIENASLNVSAVNLTGKYAAIGDFAVSANVDFIAFSKDRFSLSGDVELKNVIYNQPLSLDSDFLKMVSKLGQKKASAQLDKSNPIDLNLKVTGKNNIRIRTNLIQSDIFMDLVLSGTTQKPDLSGSIILKNGKLEYKQNDFSVTRGNISFEGDGINPFLDFESTRNVTTKIQDTNKDFRITMFAIGHPFDGELDITFESTPQLDQEQLRSLLLWGNVGDEFSGDLAIAAATDIMGITTEVRKNFRLSKFELVPKYSELDEKTVLKLIAEKEIYRNIFLLLESNPSDTTDQIIELKYRTKWFESVLGWKNKDMLETNYGGIGFDLKLEYIFE